MGCFWKKILQIDKFAASVVVALVFANILIWLAIFICPPDDNLLVNFFNIGQGDSAFIELPQGTQILIDGGPDSGVLEKLSRLMPPYDHDIDWIILSHPDRDHLNGLLAVLNNYRVHNILWSGISKNTAESDEWLNLITKENANIIVGSAGQAIDLGGIPPARIEIFAPQGENSKENANESSLLIKVVFGQRSFIFSGDADSAQEEAVIRRQFSLNADVLKVAHHGSKNSACDDFLSGVLPAAAVISVGADNPYGHPSPQVLEMLGKYDIKTLRTDLNGDILFRTDGQYLFVKTEK